MNTIVLLPRWFRFLGLALICPPIIMFLLDPEMAWGDPVFGKLPESIFNGTVYNLIDEGPNGFEFFKAIENNLLNEFMLLFMLVGSWMIAFAKVKGEDEFSQQLRLQSMASAIIWNSVLLLLLNFLIYDGLFLYVMLSQLFSFLLLFSIIFALKIRKQRKELAYEE